MDQQRDGNDQSVHGSQQKGKISSPIILLILIVLGLISAYISYNFRQRGIKLAKLEYERDKHKKDLDAKAHDAVLAAIDAEKKVLEIEGIEVDGKIKEVDEKINKIAKERDSIKKISEDTDALLGNIRRFINS